MYALVFCVTALVSGCVRTAPDEAARFAAWSGSARAAEVAAYADFLQREGVGHVAPLRALLRSGRRWRRCGAEEFSLPPREAWPAILPTLRLTALLREQGLLDHAEVASAYRTPAFNRCEGGSARSRHLANAALDFDLTATPDGVATLCAFWRREGRRRRFGLGFYGPRQIHVDTRGFRTWGTDYTRGTSPCHRPGD